MRNIALICVMSLLSVVETSASVQAKMNDADYDRIVQGVLQSAVKHAPYKQDHLGVKTSGLFTSAKDLKNAKIQLTMRQKEEIAVSKKRFIKNSVETMCHQLGHNKQDIKKEDFIAAIDRKIKKTKDDSDRDILNFFRLVAQNL